MVALHPHPEKQEENNVWRRMVEAASHDFCPSANRYVYWLKHPLAVLLFAFLGSLALGLMIAPQGYAVAGGLAAIMLLGCVWPYISLLGLRAELRFTRRRIREGEEVTGILTISNFMPWPIWGLMLERGFVRSDSPESHKELAIARIPSFSTSDFSWQFKPISRGVYPLVQPQISSSFPFGLSKRSLAVSLTNQVLVWPAIVSLESLLLSEGGRELLGAMSDFRAGTAGDVIGVRPFRSGDLLRHVHWAQTARQGRWIVCERQTSLACKTVITLDPCAEHHTWENATSSWEQAIRVLASVLHVLTQHSHPFEVRLGTQFLGDSREIACEQKNNDKLARLGSPRRGIAEGLHPSGHQADREILITTGTGWKRMHAAWRNSSTWVIVLKEESLDELPNAWITLNLQEDVLHQFARKWERSCRDVG